MLLLKSLLNNMAQVDIIHGIGTGVIRGSMGMQNETLQNITVESVFNYNASQLSSKSRKWIN